eukprot:14882346-Alexandrium_andersonii.AAC.1
MGEDVLFHIATCGAGKRRPTWPCQSALAFRMARVRRRPREGSEGPLRRGVCLPPELRSRKQAAR